MKTYVLEVDDKAAVAFRAKNDTAAEKFGTDVWPAVIIARDKSFPSALPQSLSKQGGGRQASMTPSSMATPSTASSWAWARKKEGRGGLTKL